MEPPAGLKLLQDKSYYSSQRANDCFGYAVLPVLPVGLLFMAQSYLRGIVPREYIPPASGGWLYAALGFGLLLVHVARRLCAARARGSDIAILFLGDRMIIRVLQAAGRVDVRLRALPPEREGGPAPFTLLYSEITGVDEKPMPQHDPPLVTLCLRADSLALQGYELQRLRLSGVRAVPGGLEIDGLSPHDPPARRVRAVLDAWRVN